MTDEVHSFTAGTLDVADVEQMAGRMYECVDIQTAIESGDLKTIGDVLTFVAARSNAINQMLKNSGAFNNVRRLTEAEFHAAETEVDQHVFLAGLDVDTLPRQ